jgi:dihydropteroate synthase
VETPFEMNNASVDADLNPCGAHFVVPGVVPTVPVQIMAILNVTPDSFSDGGRFTGLDALLQAAEVSIAAGTDILDIGGESTRPGALTVPVAEEIARIQPAIEALHRHFPKVALSTDTRKAAVAECALDSGASIVNDVSGLCYEPAIASIAARYNATLIIMHSQGDPQTMQQNPQYPDGVTETVHRFFEAQIAVAEQAGVAKDKLILDPGFGFGKTRAHNLTLLAQLGSFQKLGCPILAGLSRKTFLSPVSEEGKALLEPTEREALTAAGVAMAIERGAQYIRVHDVKRQAPVIRLAEAVLRAGVVMVVVFLGFTGGRSWADPCQEALQQSMDVLKSTQQQAMANQHPDPERFHEEFSKATAPLKAPTCVDELKKLTIYIEKERKKFPPAAPIED